MADYSVDSSVSYWVVMWVYMTVVKTADCSVGPSVASWGSILAARWVVYLAETWASMTVDD